MKNLIHLLLQFSILVALFSGHNIHAKKGGGADTGGGDLVQFNVNPDDLEGLHKVIKYELYSVNKNIAYTLRHIELTRLGLTSETTRIMSDNENEAAYQKLFKGDTTIYDVLGKDPIIIKDLCYDKENKVRHGSITKSFEKIEGESSRQEKSPGHNIFWFYNDHKDSTESDDKYEICLSSEALKKLSSKEFYSQLLALVVHELVHRVAPDENLEAMASAIQREVYLNSENQNYSMAYSTKAINALGDIYGSVTFALELIKSPSEREHLSENLTATLFDLYSASNVLEGLSVMLSADYLSLFGADQVARLQSVIARTQLIRMAVLRRQSTWSKAERWVIKEYYDTTLRDRIDVKAYALRHISGQYGLGSDYINSEVRRIYGDENIPSMSYLEKGKLHLLEAELIIIKNSVERLWLDLPPELQWDDVNDSYYWQRPDLEEHRAPSFEEVLADIKRREKQHSEKKK